MKRFVICSWAVFVASAMLDAQMIVPQLGVAHFSDGSVHAIRGVAANLIVQARSIGNVDSASFSDSAGLTSANGLIRLIKADGTELAEYQSDEPQPLLNIDSIPQSAVAWLPSKHLLVHWDGSQFVETPIDDASFVGRVSFLSLKADSTAQFFVVRDDSSVARFLVTLPSGRVTSADIEPSARGPVSVQQGWILTQDARGLTAERANGSRQTIQLSAKALPAGDLTMERMSNHWLHVSSKSTGTDWALYLDDSKLNLSFMPPPIVGERR
jgi:hypothetical protein